MGYTKVALEDRILEMYSEIRNHGIEVSMNFDEQKESYVVKFKKGTHELETYLSKSDADECMDGVKCVHFGVKIGEFINNFQEGD